MSRKDHRVEIPEIVRDVKTGKEFKKSKFLGRGGFATCYELIDRQTGTPWAGKVVAKAQLTKPESRDKMVQEISIHQSVTHKNIVKFKSHFEDEKNIYIILEICNKRSLMEMHKRRKTLTESEIRYFVKQIAEACQYLHERGIIHRDLKLGNLFLNDQMELKVGDFGLATRIEKPGERKLTLCGTPNYISPEVLTKKGHSFEVDVWSLGCIVYTLAVGKPPFETQELKETYKRIKSGSYALDRVSNPALRSFIDKMLKLDPKQRPSMKQLLADPYMNEPNYIPRRIPASCLTTEPRFNSRLSILPTDGAPSQLITNVRPTPQPPTWDRAPLSPYNKHPQVIQTPNAIPTAKDSEKPLPHAKSRGDMPPPSAPRVPESSNVPAPTRQPETPQNIERPQRSEEPNQAFHIKDLAKQLRDLVESKPNERRSVNMDDAEDPASAPIFWVSKWVDYTDKYGLGYALCDDSVAVLFNDVTRILLFADENQIQYIERDGVESYFTLTEFPQDYHKKVALLKYFRNYMKEHLVKMGDKPRPKDGDDMIRLPYLNNWFRTRHAICFHLTNGIVQINFFQDHTKLILCPLMSAVTYIDQNGDFKTYKFSGLKQNGCSRDLALRLGYAADVVDRLMNHRLVGARRGPLKPQPQQQQANGIATRGPLTATAK